MFQPNARLFLLNTMISGASFGIFRLLFNFYVLSLGFDEAVIGRLVTTSSLVALLAALPAGVVGDRIGRKRSLLISVALLSSAVFGIVLWRNVASFYFMNILMGLAQSLSGVIMGPFLMENSGDDERTYLFSFNSGLRMIAGFVGNWLGGRLPAMIGSWQGVSAVSPQAYAGALAIVAALALLGLIPLSLLKRKYKTAEDSELDLSPIQYARQHPKLLGKLISPMFITSLGAGLLMPFINIFFRNTHGSSDATIGSLFATGSLAMAIGLLIAPPLADRYGKMQVVVISQALSIPFLILLGFAPWFWVGALAYFVRLALMNMSTPVYQAFIMEKVDRNARATVASLVSMSWQFGWAFSPTASGWLQVNYGFDPIFIGTIISYIIAITLYWRFFLHQQSSDRTTDILE